MEHVALSGYAVGDVRLEVAIFRVECVITHPISDSSTWLGDLPFSDLHSATQGKYPGHMVATNVCPEGAFALGKRDCCPDLPILVTDLGDMPSLQRVYSFPERSVSPRYMSKHRAWRIPLAFGPILH